MKKVLLAVVLMCSFSVVQAKGIGHRAFDLGAPVFILGLIVQAANMSSSSSDLFKSVTVNQKGHGYNVDMTVFEYNRSDKSVYTIVK